MGNLGFLKFKGLGAVIFIVLVVAITGTLIMAIKSEKEEDVD